MSAEQDEHPILKSVCILVVSLAGGIAGFFVTFGILTQFRWCCSHSSVLTYSGPTWFLAWAWVSYHVTKHAWKASGQFAPIPNLAFIASTFVASQNLLFPLQESLGFGDVVPVDLLLFAIGLALGVFGLYRRIRFADRAGAGLLYAALMVLLLRLAMHVPILQVPAQVAL